VLTRLNGQSGEIKAEHLLAVTPTSHWLEYVDWANPVLQEPLEVRDPSVIFPDRPGSGISWNEKAITSFAI